MLFYHNITLSVYWFLFSDEPAPRSESKFGYVCVRIYHEF